MKNKNVLIGALVLILLILSAFFFLKDDNKVDEISDQNKQENLISEDNDEENLIKEKEEQHKEVKEETKKIETPKEDTTVSIIKTNLNTLISESKEYFAENKTYQGFCGSESASKVLTVINPITNYVYCKEREDLWIMSADLKTNPVKYYCVDVSGGYVLNNQLEKGRTQCDITE